MDIPINRNHIPKPDSFASFSHLKDINSRLSYYPDIEIGLLIGFNCPQASFPLKVVLGSSISEPYAVQTPLGWTIIGLTSPSSSPSLRPSSLNTFGEPVSSNPSKITSSIEPKAKCSSLLTCSCPSSKTFVVESRQHIPEKSTLLCNLQRSPHRKFDSSSSIQTVRKFYKTRVFPAKKPFVRYKIDSQFLGAM